MTKTRCSWCNIKNPLYVDYHDKEWALPVYDDETLFEFLILESFQAGLSWETILNKRESFRDAFDGFDAKKISEYGEDKVLQLMQNSSIVRNHRKIEASVNNARVFLEIKREFGTFCEYIWHFTNGETIYESDKTSSALSDTVSYDLKKRGMRFVGTTIIYSFLQATGIINSHEKCCFLYKRNI